MLLFILLLISLVVGENSEKKKNIEVTEKINEDQIKIIKAQAEKEILQHVGRDGRSFAALSGVLVGLQCLTFHCQADWYRAMFCCAKSQNIHCCIIYREHVLTEHHHHPGCQHQDHHHHHGGDGYYPSTSHRPDHNHHNRPDYNHNRPDYNDHHRPDYNYPSRPDDHRPTRPPYDHPETTYFPLHRPGGVVDPSWGGDYYDRPEYVDWNSRKKKGVCPRESWKSRGYDNWNLDVPLVPRIELSGGGSSQRTCTDDFDCLGRRKCCYSRINYRESLKICRYPEYPGYSNIIGHRNDHYEDDL